MYSEKKLQQILDYQHGKSTQYMWATDAGRWNAFDDPNRQDVMPTANTDWLHELFGDSFTQEHSISVNGGTDVMQYYMSANYLDEGGLLKYGDDGRQRYSFTGKINADLAKWLKVGYSVRFNRIDYSSPSFASAGENKENVFYFEKKVEIDFYVPSEQLAIQVSMQILDNIDTKERETKAFTKLKNFIPDIKCLLITNSEEAVLECNDIVIDVVPAWKWLLDTADTSSH